MILWSSCFCWLFFFFQAEDGIRDRDVTGVQTCALPISFVTLKTGAESSVDKLDELRNHVAKKIGPIAKPANVLFTPELPKTRSGKIMRRLLRDVAENRPLGDTTTLADPAVVEEIRE